MRPRPLRYGCGLSPRVQGNLRLWSESVAGHRERRGLGSADWQRLQSLVKERGWIEDRGDRLLRIKDDGKPWMAVLRRTCRDEIYLASYRRARLWQVRRWEERGGG